MVNWAAFYLMVAFGTFIFALRGFYVTEPETHFIKKLFHSLITGLIWPAVLVWTITHAND